MKFLCLECDQVMSFAERQLPGDGTLAAVYACGACGREMALLTNPMETRLVSSLGIEIGGRSVPHQPMETTRTHLAGGKPDAFRDAEDSGAEREPADHAVVPAAPGDTDGAPGPHAPQPQRPPAPARVRWSPEAEERLGRVPSFVRGMVKRIYSDWARERTIALITPEVMDRARTELGLEGM